MWLKMPRCKRGKMSSRGRRGHKKTAAKAVNAKPQLINLELMNKFYINEIPPGIPVECDKCKKWRVVREYEEISQVPEFFECSMWNLGDEKGNCYIPQIQDDSSFTDDLYTPGSLVWAKVKTFPRWPAMVEDDPCELLYCKPDKEKGSKKYHVVFFGSPVSRRWVPEEFIQHFSVPSSDKMPSKLEIRRAIEDAAKAQKMEKGERLLTYSFATRFGKEEAGPAPKNEKPKKSTRPQLQTSKENYTAGDLVWVQREKRPSMPGMVEEDSAEKIYCKSVDDDTEYHIVFFGETATKSWIKKSKLKPFAKLSADEMPLGELKKAIEEAEEAMPMTNQDRLRRFSFSVRSDKKRSQEKSKERKDSDTPLSITKKRKISECSGSGKEPGGCERNSTSSPNINEKMTFNKINGTEENVYTPRIIEYNPSLLVEISPDNSSDEDDESSSLYSFKHRHYDDYIFSLCPYVKIKCDGQRF